MKKLLVVLAIMAILALNASFALAGDATAGDGGTAVGMDNTNTNTNSATGNANATQDQRQDQKQDQSADNEFNYSNVTEDKREHIIAPLLNTFVGPPTPMADDWKPFVCQSLFSVYTKERLESTATAGSFSARKGGFFERLFSSPIKETIHVPFTGTPDEKPIVIINWEPVGDRAYATDELLGEFECQGYYGWPRGAALGQCLKKAKEKTNTSRVVAYYKIRRDPKNSGFSLGSGAGGSILGGAEGDKTAGAISLGGLIGTTTAYVDEAYDWYVLALNDGPTVPPYPLTCDLKPIEKKAAAPKTEVLSEVKKPAPTPKPEPSCDPSQFDKQLKDYDQEILWCKFPGHNNQKLRFGKGNAWLDKYFCEGRRNKQYLVNAIYEFGVAERDYKNGRELAPGQKFGEKPMGVKTTTLTEPTELDYKVHYNWALAIRELYGQDEEVRFGQSKKLNAVPESHTELKR